MPKTAEIPYKLGTDGMVEQDIPCDCPECDTEMRFNAARGLIGWGNYPQGGFRSMRKPGTLYCLVFECPKCFTKSVCHNTLDIIKVLMEDRKLDLEEGA